MTRRRTSAAPHPAEHDLHDALRHSTSLPTQHSRQLSHDPIPAPSASAAMSTAALSATLSTQLSRYSSPKAVPVSPTAANPPHPHQRGDSASSASASALPLAALNGLTGLGNLGNLGNLDPGLAYLASAAANGSVSSDHQPATDPHRVIRQMVRLCNHIYTRAFVDGACSDVTVSVPGWNKMYRLHRLVLYQNSYFSSLLEGGFREASTPTPGSVTLNFDASNPFFTPEAFEIALGRLYGRLEEPVLHSGNVLQLLATCSFLDIQDVCELCVEFVLRNLRDKNVIEYLRFADAHVVQGSDRILEAVFTFLCREGWRRLKDQFVRLPAVWLKRVLEHDAFWVPSEYERYRFAKEVITKRRRLAHERTLQEFRLQAQLHQQHLPPQPPPPPPSAPPQPQSPIIIHSEPLEIEPENPEEANQPVDATSLGLPSATAATAATATRLVAAESVTTPTPSISAKVTSDHIQRRSSAPVGGPIPSKLPTSVPPVNDHSHSKRRSSTSTALPQSSPASMSSSRRFSAFANGSSSPASHFANPTSNTSLPAHLSHSSSSLQQSLQHDEHAYRLIFAQAIYYIHMTFDELVQIRRDRDPLTGRSLVPDHIIKDALWQQTELRHKVEAATEEDVSLGATTTVGAAGGNEDDVFDDTRCSRRSVNGSGIASASSAAGRSSPMAGSLSARTPTATDGRVLHSIPTDDTTHIGESGLASASVSASAAAAAAAGRRERGRARSLVPTESEGELAEEVEVRGKGAGPAPGTGPRIEYSVFAPFRFGVEFAHVQNLKEKCRVYSESVFYAGSNWNMYIQKMRSPRKSFQLGVYLHRVSTPAICGGRHGDDDPGKARSDDSSFSRYTDRRKTVRTWFKIFCPSRGPSHNLTVFQSSPDNFTVQQSWGWRSTSLWSEEYLVDQIPLSPDGSSPSTPGAMLRFSVVMGHV